MMGTNFYWRESDKEYCGECGRPMPTVHIGKSSVGWNFALHIHPEEGIFNLEDWKKRWEKGTIWNEYGDELSADEMLRWITERSNPRGLRVHYSDSPSRPVVRGGSTWDLLAYEFS